MRAVLCHGYFYKRVAIFFYRTFSKSSWKYDNLFSKLFWKIHSVFFISNVCAFDFVLEERNQERFFGKGGFVFMGLFRGDNLKIIFYKRRKGEFSQQHLLYAVNYSCLLFL